MDTNEKFKFHQINLKSIEQAIKYVQLDLRGYINEEKNNEITAYTRILSLLITTWAEVRLLKLIFTENAFALDIQEKILSKNSLEKRWIASLEFALISAYGLKKISDRKLPATEKMRYDALLSIINTELSPILENRNRIAHGQWVYAFTKDLKKISTEITKRLKQENIVELQQKYKILKSLSSIILDLAISPPTFERDFDEHYRKIISQKENHNNANYEDYKKRQIEKYKRGLRKRRKN